MGELAVDVRNVSKSYRIYAHPRHRLLEALWRGRRTYHHDFWALRDVTIQIPQGVTVGLIGLNGSGKSTLLQVVAGVLQPTVGVVEVRGRLSSLLELGAGFNPEFTGKENVLMHGALLGFARDEMLTRLPEIEAFAEIGKFIEQPVKTYSSGMYVRLAFAAAIHVDPDVLLIDEALAVGDAVFQHRCIRRIRQLQEQGKTLLFVSHDLSLVKSLCAEVVFLDGGRVKASGEPAHVANLYHAHVASRQTTPAAPPAAASESVGLQPDPGFDQRVALFRHGTGAARVLNVELLDGHAQPLAAVEFDQDVIIRVHLAFFDDAPTWILGYFVRDRAGIDVLGTNTYEEGVAVPPLKAGDRLTIDFKQRLPVRLGTYSVTVGLSYNRDAPTYFDWVDNALVFEVLPPPGGKAVHSKVWLPVEIALRAG